MTTSTFAIRERIEQTAEFYIGSPSISSPNHEYLRDAEIRFQNENN